MDFSNCEVLAENKWVSLYTKNGFTFSHETFANGDKVGILPYRYVGNDIEVLVIYELNQAWNLKLNQDLHRSTTFITGSAESGKIVKHLIDELYEEGGYKIDENELSTIDSKFVCKSNTSLYHLAIVDLTHKQQDIIPKGDNPGDFCEWLPINLAYKRSNDFLLSYLISYICLKELSKDLL